MSDHTLLSKDAPSIPVTLDDLKQAIAAVPALDSGVKAFVYQTARANAWQTAFFWFHYHMQRPDEGKEKDAEYFAEYDEGFKLISEKLP